MSEVPLESSWSSPRKNNPHGVYGGYSTVNFKRFGGTFGSSSVKGCQTPSIGSKYDPEMPPRRKGAREAGSEGGRQGGREAGRATERPCVDNAP